MGTLRLLISNNGSQVQENDYDHVFSLTEDGSNSHPEDYLSKEDHREIFDTVFTRLMGFWENLSEEKRIFYRGVDLGWCFKKYLFELTVFVYLRLEVLTRLISKLNPSDVLIAETNKPSKYNYPSIYTILKCSQMLPGNRIKHNLRFVDESKRKRFGIRSLILALWPRMVKRGCLAEARVGFYADYSKTRGIIDRLKSEECAYLTDTKSPRLWQLSNRKQFHFWQSDSSGKKHSRQDSVIEQFSALMRGQEFQQAVYGGHEMIGTIIEKPFMSLLESHLAKLLNFIDNTEKYFSESMRLEKILLDEDISPLKNAFCQMAKKREIATFVETHGAIGNRSGFLPLTADQLFVWGDAQREKLQNWGCPPNRLKVTGSSRYEYYYKMKEEDVRNKVVTDLNLNKDKGIVLLAFAPIQHGHHLYEHQIRTQLTSVLKSALESNCDQFILKTHPGDENRNYYAQWIKSQQVGDGITIVEKYDPYLLARGTDVLIAYATTYAIDAYAMGKPVIVVDDGISPILDEFKTHSAMHFCKNSEDIQKLLNQLHGGSLSGPSAKASARSHLLSDIKDSDQFIANILSRKNSSKESVKEELQQI